MTTKLTGLLKRELDINGIPYTLTISPACLHLTRKGRRKGYELAWTSLVSGEAALVTALNESLHRIAFEVGTVLVVPPPELCTDNGAMIAWAGAERLVLGLTDTLDTPPQARWPLTESSTRKPPPAAGAPRPSSPRSAGP